jgi:hypothetical protein
VQIDAFGEYIPDDQVPTINSDGQRKAEKLKNLNLHLLVLPIFLSNQLLLPQHTSAERVYEI